MATTNTTHHETRPSYVLPSSRSKLRNLTGISIRNISFDPTPSPNRRRRQTIDDDAIPQTLQSPAKLVALREWENEGRGLEHSRSSDDLRSTVKEDAIIIDGDTPADSQDLAVSNGSPLKGKGKQLQPRPKMPGRMRRRSTLEWAHATPQRRQERLQKALAERMVDVFFSLHVAGIEESIYVSETVEKTMNPTFRRIGFEACGPGIMRSERVVVRVWVKSGKVRGWRQLMDYDVELGGLQYLGLSLDTLPAPLPHNALVLHMSDGVYLPPTSFGKMVLPREGPPLQPSRALSVRILPTSSFDALLRLAKLEDSIQDALATRNKLAADLESFLQSNKSAFEDHDAVAEAEDRLKTIDFAKQVVEKQLVKARNQIAEKRGSIQQRRKLMSQDLATRKTQADEMHRSRPDLTTYRDDHKTFQKSIRAQRRRIVTDLSRIYPLEPIAGKALAFTIRGLHLHNADDLDSALDPNSTAAALGHIAHLLQLLSYYLRTPLTYPVNPHSSTSTIIDEISKLPSNASTTQKYADEVALRTYPLCPRGVPRFRFEYAVFLLGKDIQILLEEVYGVKVVDLRQVSANLAYLLYCGMAGEGEVVGRKVGAIRGLKGLGDEEQRRGSDGSVGSGSMFARKKLSEGNGRVVSPMGRGAVESLRGLVEGRR